jgi:hypothetical protein
MIKVSVIILNWNRKKDTLECLESLSKLRIKNYRLKIIVVDNASTDDSAKVLRNYLKKLTFKSNNISGELIREKRNLGFAEGNNEGMKYIYRKSDYIVLLNNDTIVDKNFIKEFLRFSKNHPEAGILSPKIYFAKNYEFHKERYQDDDLGKVIWYAGGIIDWNNIYATNFGVDEVDKGQFDKPKEIDFATGACLFLKTDVLRKVGFLDEKYFMYLEDADFSLRSLNKNYRIYYVPKSFLWHKVAQSSKIGSELNDYFITRNRLIFGLKYAPIRSRVALVRESIRLILHGRKWQKVGVKDFYLGLYGKGSWPTA